MLHKYPIDQLLNNKQLKELKESYARSDIQYRQLYPNSKTIPQFYGLPKCHKTGTVLCPIVASCRSNIHGVAWHVTDILNPLVGRNQYALKNSADLVQQLKDCRLDETHVLVSFDMMVFFTSVLVDRSLDVIHHKPTTTKRSPHAPRCQPLRYETQDHILPVWWCSVHRSGRSSHGIPSEHHSRPPIHGVVRGESA